MMVWISWLLTAVVLSQSDTAAIRRVDAAYVNAWLSNDKAAVLRLFARDAVIVPQNREPIAGHQDMSAFWWPEDGKTTVTSFKNDILETGGSGDLAFSRGTYAFTFDYEINGETRKFSNRGNYLMLFRREKGGEWRITHRMWSDFKP
jgi:uncharacterized protein (TIGR02246 family)